MTISADLANLRRELQAPLSHPDAEGLRDLANQTAEWVANHWATLPSQHLGHYANRATLEALLRQAPPELGRPFGQVLADFENKITPLAVRVNHPRFFAFIPSAPCFPAVLGDWLIAGTNFFAGVWLEAAGPTQVELVVLDWFKEFLDYPREAGGLLTGGGSEANLTALAAAREPLSQSDRNRAVLYVSEHRHWSVDRAAKILGFWPEQINPVPATRDYRLTAQALTAAVQADAAKGRLPWAVVANAGATNTGAVDPLGDLADACQTHRLWLHVDACYGWPAVLNPEGRALFAGIGRADSIALDPHKWFAQTFEAGCLLVRDGRRLAQTFTLRPDYMQDVAPQDDEINFADQGIALTRRFRALKIWLSVQVLGLSWFRQMVARCCKLADFAERLLKQLPDFEILSPHHLSIVAFRYAPQELSGKEGELDRINLALPEKVLATGRGFLSSTRLGGKAALRFCFVNWRTTAADVEEIVELVRELGARGPGGRA